MNRVDPPGGSKTYAIAAALRQAKKEPGSWFDITDELGGTKPEAAISTVMATYVRYVSPLTIRTLNGRMLVHFDPESGDA